MVHEACTQKFVLRVEFYTKNFNMKIMLYKKLAL